MKKFYILLLMLIGMAFGANAEIGLTINSFNIDKAVHTDAGNSIDVTINYTLRA